MLVEYKPATGHVFADYLGEYTHWGYSDLDIAWGDLPRWITPDELLAGHFHPALKYAVASLRAAEKLRELQAAVAASPDNDAAIAALAREFAALASGVAPPAGTSDYRVKSDALKYECEVEVSL